MYILLVQIKERKEVYVYVYAVTLLQLMFHTAGVWHCVTYIGEGGASTLSKAVNERFQ